MFSRFFIYRPIFAAVVSIVIVIVGILSAMAIPRFGSSIANQSVDSAARRIAAESEDWRFPDRKLEPAEMEA